MPGEEEAVMRDGQGQELREGDQLLDERGRIWQVQPTEAGYAAAGCVRVKELRLVRGRPKLVEPLSYVHLAHVFRVEPFFWDARAGERQKAWRALYEEHVRPDRRREISNRRRAVAGLRRYGEGVCHG